MSKLQYWDAIKADDITTVQHMHDEQPDVVHVSDDFEYICKNGNLDMATWFLECHPCISVDIKRALKHASKKGHLHVVEWLITINRDSVLESVNAACKHGQLDIVRYMYDHVLTDHDYVIDPYGVDYEYRLTKKYMFLLACRHGHLEIVEYLLDNDDMILMGIHDAFTASCKSGQLEVAQYLANHTRINDNNIRHSIIMAATDGHVRVIEWLLQNSYTRDIYDSSDYQRVFEELCGFNLKSVLWFVAKHPDIIKDDQTQAYTLACRKNRIDVIKWLAETVQIRDDIYVKFFENACYLGHLELAQLLLDIYPGTRACISNSNLFSQVCSHDRIDVAKWLINLGASIDVNQAFSEACDQTCTKTARYLLNMYPEIDIHIDSERIFFYACEKQNVYVIKMYMEYDASYHIIYIYDLSFGYVITCTKIESFPIYIREIEYDNSFIYTSIRADSDMILQDAIHVTAVSKKKSARN